MWRKLEAATIMAAIGWTWVWIRRQGEAPASHARVLRGRQPQRTFEAHPEPEDRDDGASWDRRRRRRLVD